LQTSTHPHHISRFPILSAIHFGKQLFEVLLIVGERRCRKYLDDRKDNRRAMFQSCGLQT